MASPQATGRGHQARRRSAPRRISRALWLCCKILSGSPGSSRGGFKRLQEHICQVCVGPQSDTATVEKAFLSEAASNTGTQTNRLRELPAVFSVSCCRAAILGRTQDVHPQAAPSGLLHPHGRRGVSTPKPGPRPVHRDTDMVRAPKL